ncbi:fused response regulator/phosphatase [Uliginosibacterium aquaticum]|uniref:Fused response regulator/phosphatase n=1 Tax=Uliginosibacterium aquaticum TaxID=2731212 RepID=A0ABX2II35_9RHOO|nr:fused response regulator/phosphatase [Uliginosibacterium aquaticum]NSL56405.1 fused response regulator/phosphatase [Uliginosibacterium aquaticum]
MSEAAAFVRNTALVVDDESTGRLILKAQLEREQYRVVSAANGAEALEQFEREEPDIVFLDVILPDFYGYEVARAMKLRAGERFVPIFFLTGLSEEEALAECVAAGGDDFLSKPINFSILKSKIAAIERIRDLYERARQQRTELADLHARMQYEQQIAERILSGAVMARNVASPPIQCWLQSASTFNGDLFISAYTPAGGLSVLMGDFTGHGLAAALGALPAAETFRTMTAKGCSLTEVLAEINLSLHRILPTGMFLAAAALRIEADLQTAMVWNSGLPDIHLCRSGASRRKISSQHPPLAALSSFIPGCEPELVLLAPGDVFLLCSDGVTEACNAEGKPFGEERLEGILDACAAADTFSCVRATLTDFVAGTEQQDDISLVAIPCEPTLFAGARIDDDGRLAEDLPASAWNWSLRLEGANLARIDPVPLVMGQLSAFGISSHHRQQLYVVVSELFSNAIEHGVLALNAALKCSAEGFMEYYLLRQQRLDELAEGFVELRLDYRKEDGRGVIRVWVEDSGRGFCHGECERCDVPQILREANQSIAEPPSLSLEHCGRGMKLLRSLCRKVRYMGMGNCAEAEYVL